MSSAGWKKEGLSIIDTPPGTIESAITEGSRIRHTINIQAYFFMQGVFFLVCPISYQIVFAHNTPTISIPSKVGPTFCHGSEPFSPGSSDRSQMLWSNTRKLEHDWESLWGLHSSLANDSTEGAVTSTTFNVFVVTPMYLFFFVTPMCPGTHKFIFFFLPSSDLW